MQNEKTSKIIEIQMKNEKHSNTPAEDNESIESDKTTRTLFALRKPKKQRD